MTEAQAVLIGVLAFMSVTLTLATFAVKKAAIGFMAAGAWVFFGVYNITLSTGTWDFHWTLGFFGIFMGLVAALIPLMLNGKRDKTLPEILDGDYDSQEERDMELEADAYHRQRQLVRGRVIKLRPLSPAQVRERKSQNRLKAFLRTKEE